MKKEALNESTLSSFILTLFASSTALPGKAKPAMSIWNEAFHKLVNNPLFTNILTGVATLVAGAVGGSIVAKGGNIWEAILQSTGAALLVGMLLFVISYWIAIIYVKVTPP